MQAHSKGLVILVEVSVLDFVFKRLPWLLLRG